jgi:hypothetical protein
MTADQAAIILLHCTSPLLAQSGHRDGAEECPLLGERRTSRGMAPMSAFDPKQTSIVPFQVLF